MRKNQHSLYIKTIHLIKKEKGKKKKKEIIKMRREAPIFVGWITTANDPKKEIRIRENQIVSQDWNFFMDCLLNDIETHQTLGDFHEAGIEVWHNGNRKISYRYGTWCNQPLGWHNGIGKSIDFEDINQQYQKKKRG